MTAGNSVDETGSQTLYCLTSAWPDPSARPLTSKRLMACRERPDIGVVPEC
jgi:hypothetical protein